MPKKMPTRAEKTKASPTAQSGTWGGGQSPGRNVANTVPSPTPSTSPGAPAEQGQRRVEGEEDHVVEVHPHGLPLFLRHPDDRRRVAADVDLLADRVGPQGQLVHHLRPDDHHLAAVGDVELREEAPLLD